MLIWDDFLPKLDQFGTFELIRELLTVFNQCPSPLLIFGKRRLAKIRKIVNQVNLRNATTPADIQRHTHGRMIGWQDC